MSNREPTAMELRCANALLGEVMMAAGSPKVLNAFAMLTERNARIVLNQVIAVIHALREPDKSMLAAYMNALEQPACPQKEPWHQAKMRKRWRAMIDAASPPEEQPWG